MCNKSKGVVMLHFRVLMCVINRNACLLCNADLGFDVMVLASNLVSMCQVISLLILI